MTTSFFRTAILMTLLALSLSRLSPGMDRQCFLDYRVIRASGHASPVHGPSSAAWEKYAADFQRTSQAAIAKQPGVYQAALAAGHPHAVWLHSVGFRFEGPQGVVVPELPAILKAMEAQLQADLNTGKIRPEDTIRPARVFQLPVGTLVPVPIGGEIPEGATPYVRIVPLPVSNKMLADGYFVIGEPETIGPRESESLGTVMLHDLAHHSSFLLDPELMAAHRAAARQLVKDLAFYRGVEYIRNFKFISADLKALREHHLLAPEIEAALRGKSDTEAARALNALPQRARLDAQAALVQAGLRGNPADPTNPLRPLGDRATEGVRFTMFLENGFAIDRRDADILFQQWKREGTLPAGAKENYGDHRYTVEEVRRHNERLSPAQLTDKLAEALQAFERVYKPIGGLPRDIFQVGQRRNEQPQGHAFYSTPLYLKTEAERILAAARAGQNVEPAVLADASAKLQVSVLEGSRFTPKEWLESITKLSFDPESEVGRFFTQTGLFPRDLYYYSHGGAVTPTTPQAKVQTLASNPNLRGIVTEIGAGQEIARHFATDGHALLVESRSDYKTGASDLQYGSLGEKAPVEAYASVRRLDQQLAVDFARVPVTAGQRKFVIADAAETSRGNGHAWIGIRAQTPNGGEPVTIRLHVRLLGARTSDQKQDLATLGVNLLHTAETGGDLRALKDSIAHGNIAIDFATVTGRADGQVPFDLLRAGLAQGVAFDKNGHPVPAQEAFAGQTSEAIAAQSVHLTAADLALGEKSPVFQQALAAARAAGKPLLVLAPHTESAQRFAEGLNFRDKKPTAVAVPVAQTEARDPQAKAERLNKEREYVLSIVDAGGRQGIVNQLFDARNVGILFRSEHFGQAAHLPGEAASAPLDRLIAKMDRELTQVDSKRPHRKAVVGNVAEVKDGKLEGYLVVRGQVKQGGADNRLVVRYSFPNDAAAYQKVANLGINALYAFSHPAADGRLALASLSDGIADGQIHVHDLKGADLKIAALP